MMYNVAIVERDNMSQQLLEIFIHSSENYQLLYSEKSVSEKEFFNDMQQIDIILIDVCTVMECGGIEMLKKIKQVFPNIKILMITNQPEYSFIECAYQVEADGFWYKSENAREIITIMDKIMDGEKIYPTHTPIVQIGHASSIDFTKRELEVLRKVVSGEKDVSIAEQLNISIRTVKGHIQSIKEKTGLRNRTEIAVCTTACGFVINFGNAKKQID